MRILLASTAIATLLALSVPAYSQTTAPIDKSEGSLSHPDDSQKADIKMWQDRIETLIERVISDAGNYVVPEQAYSSNNIKLLNFYLQSMNSFEMSGDYNRLLDHYVKTSEALNSERFKKTVLIAKIQNINDEGLIETVESQKIIDDLKQDPDWFVALNTHAVILQSRLNLSHSSVIDGSEYASYIVPPKSDPLYNHAMYILTTMKLNEASYKLQYEQAYELLIELIYYAEKSKTPEIILSHVQNIITALTREYGEDAFEALSNKILDIDFNSDAYSAQNILVHVSTYRNSEPDDQIKLLEEALALGPNSEFFQRETIILLMKKALATNNIDILNKYIDSPIFQADLKADPNSVHSVFIDLRNGKTTQAEAVARINKNLRIKLTSRRRDLATQAPNTKSNIDLVFENGKVITHNSDNPNLEEIINLPVENSLSKIQSDTLGDIINRIYLAEKLSITPIYPNARYTESFFADKPNITSDTRRHFERFKRGKNISVALSNFRHSYPKIYSRKLTSDTWLSPSDIAYTSLLDINMLIRSGRIETLWPQLLRLKSSSSLKGTEYKHLLFDIRQTEATLLFLEGSVDELLIAVNDIINEAIALKRNINAQEYMAMLAISLIDNEYNTDAKKIIDAWIANEPASNHPDYLPLILQGRITSHMSDKTEAPNGLLRTLPQTVNKTDSVLINSELLKYYTDTKNIDMIERYRSILLSELQDIENDSIYKIVKPSLLEANYIIAKANDDQNAPDLYTNYVSANSVLLQNRRTTQTVLGQNRFDAHKFAMNETFQKLNESNENIQTQKGHIKLLSLSSIVIFLVSLLALYKAYISSLRTAKARKLNDKRQKVTNRIFKDGFHKSKRFNKRFMKHLEKLRRNTDDVALIALIDDMAEELSDYDREQVKFSYVGRRNIGTQAPLNEAVNLTSFFNKKSAYWKTQVPGTDIDIRFITNNLLPTVKTDHHMLEIILMEMIEHSIEHTVYGKIDVMFKYIAVSKHLEINVSDTGNGDQNSIIDYVITKEAVKSLNGQVTFPKHAGYAHTIEIILPVNLIDYVSDSKIDHSTIIPLRSVNDK